MSDVAGEIVIQGVLEFPPSAVSAAQANARRIADVIQREFNRASTAAGGATKATDQLNASLKRTAQTADKTRQGFTTFGGSLDDMEKGLITVAIAATQVGQALTRVITRPFINAIKQGIKGTSDLTEVINLTTVTFGQSTDAVVDWSESLDRAFGLTQREALEARSNFALLFNELGIGMEKSTELSQQLVERIGDIASLRNVPVAEVSRRIQSGLVGETEAVRRLGIVLDESVIKREAVRQGIIAEGEALTAEQKIELRAQQILAQTTEAQGDAVNTADTFAGVLRRLNVVTDELTRAFAEAFIPALTFLGNILVDVLEFISDLPGPLRVVAVLFGGVLAVVGPLSIALGGLATTVLAVRGAMLVLTGLKAAGHLTALTGVVHRLTVAFNLLKLAAIPLAILGVGLLTLKNSIDNAKRSADELVASLSEDIDTNTLDGLETKLNNITVALDTQMVEWHRFDGIGGILRGTVEILSPLPDTVQTVTEKTHALNQEFGTTTAQIQLINEIFGFVARKTGESIDSIIQRAKVLNIELGNIAPAERFEIGDQLVDSFTPVFKPISEANEALKGYVETQTKLVNLQERVASAQQSVVSALERVSDANEGVADANERLADTHERLVELTSELADLEAERLVLINDTARDIREVVEAEEALVDVGNRLKDLDQEEADILAQIRELKLPADARELADIDRDIERAKIAKNKAIREEQELLASLNEEQETSLDLSGLSLDQLRTTLANARASAAAQRAAGRETRSQVEIEEEQILARISVGDATEHLNDLLDERTDIEDRVINNSGEIAELEERLTRLQSERVKVLRDQVDAQTDLNSLRSGETTRAEDIKRIDEQILIVTNNIKTANDNIVTAVNNVKEAEDRVLTAVQGVREAERDVLQAKKDQKFETTLLLGTEQEINDVLQARLGLQQNPQLLQRIGTDSLAALLPTLTDPTQRANVAFRQSFGSPAFLQALGQALINDPRSPLSEILRQLGVQGFAEGGVITSPMMARMGENYKPEMVLPLTKPDRVWQLLSSTLPRFPGALAAAQSAVGAPAPALPRSVLSGVGRTQNKDDGPMTFGQAREMITLLRENGKPETHVEVPVTIAQPVEDPELLAKRISRQVERRVIDRLRR